VELEVLEVDKLVEKELVLHQRLTLTLELRLQEDQELLAKEMLVEQVVLQGHLDLLVVEEVVNLPLEEMEQMLVLEEMVEQV
jgi:hypothetical protein